MTPELYLLTTDGGGNGNKSSQGRAVRLTRVNTHPSTKSDVFVMGPYVEDDTKQSARLGVITTLAYLQEHLEDTIARSALNQYVETDETQNGMIPCGNIAFALQVQGENGIGGILGKSAGLAFATAFTSKIVQDILSLEELKLADKAPWPVMIPTGALDEESLEEGLVVPMKASVLNPKARTAAAVLATVPDNKAKWFIYPHEIEGNFSKAVEKSLSEAQVRLVPVRSVPILVDHLLEEIYGTTLKPVLEELTKRIETGMGKYRHYNSRVKILHERLHSLVGYQAMYFRRAAQIEIMESLVQELENETEHGEAISEELRERIINAVESGEKGPDTAIKSEGLGTPIPGTLENPDSKLSPSERAEMREAFVGVMRFLSPILNGGRIDHDYVDMYEEVLQARDQDNLTLVTGYWVAFAGGCQEPTSVCGTERFAWGLTYLERLKKTFRELKRMWNRVELWYRRLAPQEEAMEEGIEKLQAALGEQHEEYRRLIEKLKEQLDEEALAVD